MEEQDKDLLTYDKVVTNQTEKAIEYHNIKLKLEIFDRIFSPLFLIVLIFARIPNWLRNNSPFGSDYSFLAIAWVVILFLTINFFVNLPLSYYSETIERKFEFATRTTKKWVKDQFKALILSVVILCILFEGIYAGINGAPDYWWIYAFIGYFFFMGVLQTLSPFLISLFTKIESLPEGEVRTMVEKLATTMDLKYKDIYRWNISDQSTKANAAVVGFGKTIRIMLGDTLINNFRLDEIEVVMAHEIGHQKNKDMYRGLIFMGIMSLIAFFFIDLGFDQAISTFALTSKSDPASIGYFITAFSIIFELTSSINLYYTRTREKAADIVAIKQLNNLEVYESAFARLGEQNLSYPNPSKLEVLLRYSHPPTKERIAYAKEYVNKQKI